MNLLSLQNNALVTQRVREAVALTDTNETAAVGEHPWLIPSSAVRSGIGGLLVPPELRRKVTRNGVPLVSGVHVLHHADRLEYEGGTWWVAAGSEIGPVPYDAGVHGEDVHCLITKARLQTGELIVVCPGPAGGDCGAIYRQPAWEMVLESNDRFRCPRCGFDPAAGEWQPTLPPRTNLPQLFELARRRRGEGAA